MRRSERVRRAECARFNLERSRRAEVELEGAGRPVTRVQGEGERGRGGRQVARAIRALDGCAQDRERTRDYQRRAA
eukprot:6983779-Prymnesium_polylepis.1